MSTVQTFMKERQYIYYYVTCHYILVPLRSIFEQHYQITPNYAKSSEVITMLNGTKTHGKEEQGKTQHETPNQPRHDKTNKVTVRPAKTQISLGIRPV